MKCKICKYSKEYRVESGIPGWECDKSPQVIMSPRDRHGCFVHIISTMLPIDFGCEHGEERFYTWEEARKMMEDGIRMRFANSQNYNVIKEGRLINFRGVIMEFLTEYLDGKRWRKEE